MTNDALQKVQKDIEQGRCVLLIGPEVCSFQEKTLIEYVHEMVQAQNEDQIAYYYSKDNLFLFKSDFEKEEVRRSVQDIYRDVIFPKRVYQKILETPIPLIISLNPDTYLTDLAKRAGLPHDFSHFRFNGEGNEKIEQTPTKARPLIYNLLGSREEEESLVLNYEDLFNLLKALLPNGLPDKIRVQLRKARSFLFLGCDFKKWYAQLLLQLLTGDRPGRSKLAINRPIDDEHARSFLITQFGITFLGQEHQFFDELHEALATRYQLRVLQFPDQNEQVNIESIRRLIAEGKLNQALALTQNLILNTKQLDTLIGLVNRYKDWEKKNMDGLFLPGEAETLKARIVSELLNLLNGLL